MISYGKGDMLCSVWVLRTFFCVIVEHSQIQSIPQTNKSCMQKPHGCFILVSLNDHYMNLNSFNS